MGHRSGLGWSRNYTTVFSLCMPGMVEVLLYLPNTTSSAQLSKQVHYHIQQAYLQTCARKYAVTYPATTIMQPNYSQLYCIPP